MLLRSPYFKNNSSSMQYNKGMDEETKLVNTACKTLDSHSCVDEFSNLLGCYAVSTDK
jgi:hypothetical protein